MHLTREAEIATEVAAYLRRRAAELDERSPVRTSLLTHASRWQKMADGFAQLVGRGVSYRDLAEFGMTAETGLGRASRGRRSVAAQANETSPSETSEP